MTPMEAFNNLPPEQQKQVVDLGLKATEKLSNGIFKVLGYKLEAKHMKAMADAEAYKTKVMADAKAYEIDTIGTAIRNNKDLPVSFNSSDNTLSIDITNPEQLIQRSNYRLQYQQAKKEYNIESVIGKTVLELGDKSVESKDEIDEDWLSRFFDSVEEISDEDMQNLWARILAGEILRPRTYSLRLLDFLHNSSKEELDRILKISPFVVLDVLDGFIIQSEKMLENIGITFDDILFYSEIGILHSNIQIGRTYTIKALEKKHMIFYNNEYVCIGNNKSNTIQQFQFSIYSVTRLGMELFKLANTPTNKDFFVDNIKQWGVNYPNIELSFYRINYLKNNNIEYDADHPIIEINKE